MLALRLNCFPVVGFLNPMNRLSLHDLWNALTAATRDALAVGIAAATLTGVVGVVTLTGVKFRLGYVVVRTETDIGAFLSMLSPLSYCAVGWWALFVSLSLIAISCIIKGAGHPDNGHLHHPCRDGRPHPCPTAGGATGSHLFF